jgi:hypothetical protein
VDNTAFANELKGELNHEEEDGLQRSMSCLSTEADNGSTHGDGPCPSGDFAAHDESEATSLVGSNAMDLATLSMREVKGCGGDDYRLMKR